METVQLEFARGRVLAIAGTMMAVLVALSGRYGYHRDELYFIEAGRHPASGYPDQPPLVPLLARTLHAVGGGSLCVLRAPSALVVAIVVVLAGAMAWRLGAGRGGQVLAAAATATSSVLLAIGHLLSTATLGLLGWVLVSYLLLRLLQGAEQRLWLAAGLVAGVTAEANVLIGVLLVAFAASLALAGPRSLLRSPWPWAGAALAAALVAPYLLWQGGHGWPQLTVAADISAGGSGSSASRLLFVPLLLLQVGPLLAPIWIAGLVVLLRQPALRSLGWTFIVLLSLFVLLGGKPYYLAGLMPLLFASGAEAFLGWVRGWVAVLAIALSLPAMVLVLPILPVRALGPVAMINYDAGETVGWPQFVRQVADTYRLLPEGTAIVTGNYGEAGAIDRYGRAQGLSAPFSGHNAYWLWGHPPGQVPALVIGIDPALLDASCESLQPLGKIESPDALDNDENGTELSLCTPRRPWAELWPSFRHLG